MSYNKVLIIIILMGGFAFNVSAQDMTKGKKIYEIRCL